MWSFTSHVISGSLGQRKAYTNASTSVYRNACTSNPDCSDDDVSSCSSREEGLECPICWESFNMVENVPYVLWCGHTLCKNCVLGLQRAVVKFPTVPIQLPLFVACPWCHVLSFRLIYKGNLKFPRKNFFLLWMVESMNGDRPKDRPKVHSCCGDQQPVWPSDSRLASGSSNASSHQRLHPNPNHESQGSNYLNVERINASLKKSMAFFFSPDSQVPTCHYLPSYSSLRNSSKCRHLDSVHPGHYPVCTAFFLDSIFCLP